MTLRYVSPSPLQFKCMAIVTCLFGKHLLGFIIFHLEPHCFLLLYLFTYVLMHLEVHFPLLLSLSWPRKYMGCTQVYIFMSALSLCREMITHNNMMCIVPTNQHEYSHAMNSKILSLLVKVWYTQLSFPLLHSGYIYYISDIYRIQWL